jgi:hypothetical protein
MYASVPVKGGFCVNRYVENKRPSDVASLDVSAEEWQETAKASTAVLSKWFFESFIFVGCAAFGSILLILLGYFLNLYAIYIILILPWSVYFANTLRIELYLAPRKMEELTNDLNARIFGPKALSISYKQACFGGSLVLQATEDAVAVV